VIDVDNKNKDKDIRGFSRRKAISGCKRSLEPLPIPTNTFYLITFNRLSKHVITLRSAKAVRNIVHDRMKIPRVLPVCARGTQIYLHQFPVPDMSML